MNHHDTVATDPGLVFIDPPRLPNADQLGVERHPDEDPHDLPDLAAAGTIPTLHPWPRGRCRSIIGTVPCSLMTDHAGQHRYPPIQVRSRYGMTRVHCWACDWSVTYDVKCHRPANIRESARWAIRFHLVNAHGWDA
jgi:hypothetical protein